MKDSKLPQLIKPLNLESSAFDEILPIQFDFTMYWSTLVKPHLYDLDVQDALDKGMQDYCKYANTHDLDGNPIKLGKKRKLTWKRGDPPFKLEREYQESDRNEDPSPGDLSWYQAWNLCHYIAPFVQVIGKKIFHRLDWECFSNSRHWA